MASKKIEKDNLIISEDNLENKKSNKNIGKKKYAPDDMIPCRSVTYGELILEGYKSKLLYIWANQGDITNVEYQDLLSLQSRKSRFLVEPLFIIEDEHLVDEWSSLLKPIYEKIETEDIEQLLTLPVNQFRAKLKKLPDGIRESVKSMVAAKILSGEFDSIKKIKVIDEILGTELITTVS